MPRKSDPLTALKVKSAKPGSYTDGGGLMLVVGKSSASWMLRYRFDGKRRDMGLGPARGEAALSLSVVRLRAAEARAQLAGKVDPLAAKGAEAAERQAAEARKAKAALNSFRAAAEALHQAKAGEWKNPKHAAQWLATLKAHVFPTIGAMPVAKVDTDDVLRVLQPIWAKTPETASRVRQRIEAVLNYAAATGFRPRGLNPAIWRGHLSEVLGKPSKLQAAVRRESGRGENHPALPWQDMSAFLAALATRRGMAALALRFAILTGARTGEVRGMIWGEVDTAAALWVVPAARMKAGTVHFVPLSPAALVLLAEVKPLATGRDSLVFPGMREGRPLSDMSLSMLVRGMACDGLQPGELPRWRDAEGRVAVPHGFRASFKAWSLAQGWGDHLSEKALAHADSNKVRAAYAREPLTEERRPMMQAWADWCGKSGAGAVASLAAEKAKRMVSA